MNYYDKLVNFCERIVIDGDILDRSIIFGAIAFAFAAGLISIEQHDYLRDLYVFVK